MGKVLVVDDWAQVASAIRRELLRDFEVLALAPELAAAIEEPRSLEAAVLDILMPQISGLELAAQLRARGFTGPIVFVTTSDGPDLPAKVAALPPSALLYKPWAPGAVREALLGLLQG